MKKSSKIIGMFDRIVPKYDFLNHFLSIGFDYGWRKKAVKSFSNIKNDDLVLDICSGTGDLLYTFIDTKKMPFHSISLDGSYKMLDEGRKKAVKKKYSGNISYLAADAMQLPLGESCVNAAMCAFGVRNLPDSQEGIKEIFRILKRGGEFVILEFSVPENRLFKALYGFYFKRILPLAGGLISGDRQAYSYLVKSVYSFNENTDVCAQLTKAGFDSVKRNKLTFGIVSLYYAKKP